MAARERTFITVVRLFGDRCRSCRHRNLWKNKSNKFRLVNVPRLIYTLHDLTIYRYARACLWVCLLKLDQSHACILFDDCLLFPTGLIFPSLRVSSRPFPLHLFSRSVFTIKSTRKSLPQTIVMFCVYTTRPSVRSC